MKPILAIDLNGALMRSRPFREAHDNWFSLFATLLHRPELNELSSRSDFMSAVDDIMDAYLGPVNDASKRYFARQLYGFSLVASAHPDDVVFEFVELLTRIKSSFRLALITSLPAPAVAPLLEKLGIDHLFDIIYKSSPSQAPDKFSLFKRFVSEFDTPQFYIGKGDRDLKDVKTLDIETISVSWVEKGSFTGDHDVSTVEELEAFFQSG